MNHIITLIAKGDKRVHSVLEQINNMSSYKATMILVKIANEPFLHGSILLNIIDKVCKNDLNNLYRLCATCSAKTILDIYSNMDKNTELLLEVFNMSDN